MEAAGFMIFIAIVAAWVKPHRFGAWMAEVRRGYDKTYAKKGTGNDR